MKLYSSDTSVETNHHLTCVMRKKFRIPAMLAAVLFINSGTVYLKVALADDDWNNVAKHQKQTT